MIAPARTQQTGHGSISTGNGIEFFPVQHASTFMGKASTMASTYRDYDIALRNSIENARLMRNDSSIMECLEARQRAVALLKWHVEPEDDRSPEQKQLAEEMTRVLMRTPRFMEMRRVLQEAVWYGKSAVQVMYNADWINGYRRFCILSPDRDTPAWLPIHGDKLVFRHDDLSESDRAKGRYPFQVGIRVGSGYKAGQRVRGKYEVEHVSSQYRGTEAVDRGMAYFVDQEDRSKLIIHKHSIEDGAYEDILSAGSIHGVGVRSRIYWDWLQKQEIQAMLLAYIERYHGGIEIYRFPLGNDEAEKAVDSAIRNRQPGRAALKVPIPMGEDAMQYGVEVFESSMAGVQQMQDLLTNFYGHRIKRYILGQILSSESEATGLGSGVADLHLESLLQIIEYDATGLEETITEEPLRRLQHANFPSSKGIRLRFKIDTREADSDAKLNAVRQAWEMGARVKESDVLDQCGLSAPTAADRVLPAPGGGQGKQPPGMPGMPHEGPPKIQASVPGTVTADPHQEPAKYSYATQEPDLRSAIEKAAAATDPDPSDAQKLAGNYRKGQFHWNGWTIAIETPAGSIRRGRNRLGVEWSHQIPVHYGYIRRTESDADGDHIDVFVGPDPESPVVFVVDQVKGNSQFDEHKVMIGFMSEAEAIDAYRASYSEGWQGFKSITAMTVNQFRAWVEEGDSGSPIEEQVSRYSRQGTFNWDESEHPRNENGEFVEKATAETPQDARKHGARRSRTDVQFEKPIIGPSGAKLTGYSWKWTWEVNPELDEEVKVSDWNEAVPSDHTGRHIVHQFSVFKDGEQHTTSLESSMKLLGLADDSLPARKVRNLATTAISIGELEMQLEQEKAKENSNRWSIEGIEAKLKDARRRKDRYEKEAEMMLAGKSPADHYRSTATKALELFHLFKSDHMGNRWANVMVDRLADEWMRRTSATRQERNVVHQEGRSVFNDLAKSINATTWGDKRPKTPDPDWTDAKIRNWFTSNGDDAEAAIDAAEEWLSKYHPAFKAK